MIKKLHALLILILIVGLFSCNSQIIKIGKRPLNDANINDDYQKKQKEHKSINTFSAKKKRVESSSQHKKKKRKLTVSKKNKNQYNFDLRITSSKKKKTLLASKRKKTKKNKSDIYSKSPLVSNSKTLSHAGGKVYVKKKERKKFLFKSKRRIEFIGDTKSISSSKDFKKKKNYLNKRKFSRKNKRPKSALLSGSRREALYNFNKKKIVLKRKGFFNLYPKKHPKTASSVRLKGRHTKGLYEFNKKHRAVVSKKGIFFFNTKDKRGQVPAYLNYKEKNKNGKNFSKRHFNYVGRRGLLSFIFQSMRSSKTARYSPRGTRGSYQFDTHKKKVIHKKNYLFFFYVKKHEPETSTFGKGKRYKFFKLSLFKKNRHRVFKHRRSIFKKRHSDDAGHKKILEMELFIPSIRKKYN